MDNNIDELINGLVRHVLNDNPSYDAALAVASKALGVTDDYLDSEIFKYINSTGRYEIEIYSKKLVIEGEYNRVLPLTAEVVYTTNSDESVRDEVELKRILHNMQYLVDTFNAKMKSEIYLLLKQLEGETQ